MKKIKNFNNLTNSDWNIIRDTLKDALDKAGKKLNLQFSFKNISYDEATFSTKIQASIKDGSVDDKYVTYKANFEARAWEFKLEKSDFLTEFVFQGEKYKLIGWNNRGSILCESVKKGINYKLPTAYRVEKINNEIIVRKKMNELQMRSALLKRDLSELLGEK